MEAAITFTLGDLGKFLIGLALLVLIIYCIVFVSKLIPAVKKLHKVLDDAQTITSIASEGVQTAKDIVGDVSTSVSTISGILKGNQSVLAALTNIVNAVTSLTGLVKKSKQQMDGKN